MLLAEQNAAKALAVCSRAWVLQTGRVAGHGPAAELAASQDMEKSDAEAVLADLVALTTRHLRAGDKIRLT